ncbi:MAG: hypothetical protein M1824_002625 [Vezdaea acicularis]|nr:MAG: hypothetical protein M1824_002625 [Vezdaea acicularis]
MSIAMDSAPQLTPGLSDLLHSGGFFSAANINDEHTNVFDADFKHIVAKHDAAGELTEPLGFNFGGYSMFSSRAPSPGPNGSIERQVPTASKPVDDEPHSIPSPRNTSLNVAPAAVMWNASKLEQDLNRHSGMPAQEPSPPDSSRSPPQDWSYMRLDNRTNQRKTSETPNRFGQITPPNDNTPDPSLPSSTYEFNDPSAATQPTTKRKRSNAAPPSSSSRGTSNSPRRQRKPNARGKQPIVEEKPQYEEDGKRSRFLERNRVAASKCRQKKKEWTSNLETRARQLQADKTRLTMVVGSLKDEMLWLKGELLQHSNCDCHRIRQYLSHEAANFAANPLIHPTPRAPDTGSPSDSHIGSSRHASFAAFDDDQIVSGMSSLAASPALAEDDKTTINLE